VVGTLTLVVGDAEILEVVVQGFFAATWAAGAAMTPSRRARNPTSGTRVRRETIFAFFLFECWDEDAKFGGIKAKKEM
jgi:hypothetical protein